MAIEPNQTPRTPPELADEDPRVPVAAGVEAAEATWRSTPHVPVDRQDHPHEAPPEAPAGPHRGRARAARRPLRHRRGARRRGRAAGRPPPPGRRLRVRLRAPRRPAPPVGRGLHRPPGRRGEDLRGHAARHGDAVRRAAARHGRGHDARPRRGPRGLRRRGRRPGRRRHQAHRHHLPVARRGAGRELPQDDGRDGHGRPGHPHQARRPPAQHAHARRDAEAEADREGQGDPRDLRAARAPARHPRHQVGARGPLLRDAAPAQVPGDQGPGQPAARGARALRGQGRRLPDAGARGARHPRRDLRAREALLLHLLEDDQEGPRVQRDLRPHGHAGDRGVREGLLRRGRRHPLAVEAAARAVQGHDRHAQVQHVPGPPHHGDRARGQAARDPDPHAATCTRRPSTASPRTGATRRARAATACIDPTDAKLKWLKSLLDWQSDVEDPRSSPTTCAASSSRRRSSSSRPRAR